MARGCLFDELQQRLQVIARESVTEGAVPDPCAQNTRPYRAGGIHELSIVQASYASDFLRRYIETEVSQPTLADALPVGKALDIPVVGRA